MKNNTAYAAAGVDIDEMDRALRGVKKDVASTKTASVLSDIGRFGGLFKSPGADRVLVASTDGVGTKLKVAAMAGRHGTVGQCLVNHCVNDILTQGAEPLFFLDYIGAARLKASVFRQVVAGLCKACRENGCALLGGETAEMPGLYPDGEYDLVGTIIGAAGKNDIIDGSRVRAGDVLVGLPSTGLQTNGYSLARKIIFEEQKQSLSDVVPGAKRTFRDVLLAVHASFLAPVRAVRAAGVRPAGMAHITGGGLLDNLPRMLPAGLHAAVNARAWKTPPIFKYLQERGGVDAMEMHRVFNMGVGYVLAVSRADAAPALNALERSGAKPAVIGSVEKGGGGVDIDFGA